jgi:hypothetical protein
MGSTRIAASSTAPAAMKNSGWKLPKVAITMPPISGASALGKALAMLKTPMSLPRSLCEGSTSVISARSTARYAPKPRPTITAAISVVV